MSRRAAWYVRLLLSVLFTTMAAAAPAGAAPPLFPDPAITAGGETFYSASADLNADGNPDIVTANFGTNDVSVLLGTGEGAFLPETRIGAGFGPFWVDLGDLNGDGAPDAVVANSGGTLSILLGQGDGTFIAGPDVNTGGSPTAAFIGLFDAGTVPDLAALDNATGVVRIYRGNGDGTFALLSTTPVPGGYGMTSGDFNNDGRLDLAISSYASGSFWVLLSSGTGMFSTLGPFPAGIDPEFIASDEFNGDGKRDLVIANSAAGSIDVRLGHGDGTFDPPITATVGTLPFNLVTGDFNEDGRRDIATLNGGTYTLGGDVSVLLGDGSGGFAPERRTSGFYLVRPFAIVSDDFDHDGHPDIAVNDSFYPSSLFVFFGDGSGDVGSRRSTVPTGQESREPAVGDINGDGKPDLVVPLLGAYPASTDRLAFFVATPGGTYEPAGELAVTAPFQVFVEDLDGDGFNDLLVCTRAYAYGQITAIFTYKGDGAGGFSYLGYAPSGGGPALLADLDGDGIKDVARTVGSATTSQLGVVRVHLGVGDGSYGPGVDYAVAPFAYGLTADDFNADGIPDIAVANSRSKDASVPGDLSILLGNGDGTFQPFTAFGSDGGASFVAAGEFTGDGIPDLMVSYDTQAYQSTAPGAFRLFAGDGNGGFTPCTSVGASGRGFGMITGDLDNDGHDDLAATAALSPGGPSGQVVLVLRGDGGGAFRPEERFYEHERSPYITAGDLNLDGRTDLVIGGWTLVEILPNQGPLPAQPLNALAAADSPAECTSAVGAVVTLDATGSNGPGYPAGTLDGIVAFDWYEDFGAPTEAFLGSGETLDTALPLGTHAITLQITDQGGASDTDTIVVEVVDTKAPGFDPVIRPALLWPPNHRMIPVEINGMAVDACDPSPSLSFLGTVSSELDDAPGNGDGHTTGDIQVVSANGGAVSLLLRAERDAAGSGRTYTVTWRATDNAGNATEVSAAIPVPHDFGGTADPISLDVTRPASPGGANTSLGWASPPAAISYGVLRGPISGLSAAGSYTMLADTVCLGRDLPVTSLGGSGVDESPLPGRAFFYLVEYFDGGYSGYGTAGSGGEIVVSNGDWCR